MVFYLRDVQVLIKSDHTPLQKFIFANTTNDRLTTWAQDIFAITPHTNFEHLKGTQNILSDAISRIKSFALYNDIPSQCDSCSSETTSNVLPSQEDLEVPIFDRDVKWHVNHVNTEKHHGFMLNDTWYEIDNNTSAQEPNKPNNGDTMQMIAPATQLKLSTAQLCKMQIADKQHAKLKSSSFKDLNSQHFY